MSQLQINLSGSVNASNFNEWKTDLLLQLDQANRELQSDDDFAHAASLVKTFKSAENKLKQTKQDALNQVSEIQQLFDAIDEVVERTRQTRLALDRQVKTRKEQIKSALITAGLERIQAQINSQPGYFSHQDHSPWLNHARVNEATKRKTTTETMQAAIDELCGQIELEITQASATVQANKARLEQLPPADRELFPDVHQLIAQQPHVLEQRISERLAQRQQRLASTQDPATTDVMLEPLPAEKKVGQSDALALDTEAFKILLDFKSDETSAKHFAKLLASTPHDNISLINIRLQRASN